MDHSNFDPIPGFPGHKINRHGVVLGKRGKPMKPQLHDGYLQVKLTLNGKSVTRQIHILVAITYLGPRPEGMIVRHIEQPRTNNHVSNLRYGTHTENNHDTVRHGNHHSANKTHCPRNHEYTPDNTYIAPNGSRTCRKCKRDHQIRSRALRTIKSIDAELESLENEHAYV